MEVHQSAAGSRPKQADREIAAASYVKNDLCPLPDLLGCVAEAPQFRRCQ